MNIAMLILSTVINPYADVDWSTTQRIKTQFHDHFHDAVVNERLLAYESAGYDAIAYSHYSGYDNGGRPFTESRWPPDKWIDVDINATLFPSAEQVSPNAHDTLSPFFHGYLDAKVDYHDSASLAESIASGGGLPIIAHPTVGPGYVDLTHVHGVEIFSSYFANNRVRGVDQNPLFLEYWDEALMDDPSLIGIASNDWYGPQADVETELKDAGYVILLAPDNSLESLRNATESGALLSVRDLGHTKGGYAEIANIDVSEHRISIHTNGSVSWIVDGEKVSQGLDYFFYEMPLDARYVRAEIDFGPTTIYTQAFAVPEPNLLWWILPLAVRTRRRLS